jgi:hypothetical protein
MKEDLNLINDFISLEYENNNNNIKTNGLNFFSIDDDNNNVTDDYKILFGFNEDSIKICAENKSNNKKLYEKKFSLDELKKIIKIKFNKISEIIPYFKSIQNSKLFSIFEGEKNLVINFSSTMLLCYFLLPQKRFNYLEKILLISSFQLGYIVFNYAKNNIQKALEDSGEKENYLSKLYNKFFIKK